MNNNQIELYKNKISNDIKRLAFILMIGLVAEGYSVYMTYIHKNIVEQGALPALLALVCIAIYLIYSKKINKRQSDLSYRNYTTSDKVILSINKDRNKYMVEFEGTTDMIRIDKFIGVIEVGDPVTVVYWKTDGTYDIVQKLYM